MPPLESNMNIIINDILFFTISGILSSFAKASCTSPLLVKKICTSPQHVQRDSAV